MLDFRVSVERDGDDEDDGEPTGRIDIRIWFNDAVDVSFAMELDRAETLALAIQDAVAEARK
jgi:hypothetical protein